MTKYIYFFLFLFTSFITFGQDYLINEHNGETILGCGGNFYDSGGFALHC